MDAATTELLGQNKTNANIRSGTVNSKSADDTELRIERIGKGIDQVAVKKGEPPVQLDIEKLMKLYNVPGLSVAVTEYYKIAWGNSYCVTLPGSTVSITPKMRFRSVSDSNAAPGVGM